MSARVLFDGTHCIDVNTSTRIRDQERAPIAADLKRAMREKWRLKERTFSLTADVSEAHRQVPIAPQDWHLLGCQVRPINHVRKHGWHVRRDVSLTQLVTDSCSLWSTQPEEGPTQGTCWWLMTIWRLEVSPTAPP